MGDYNRIHEQMVRLGHEPDDDLFCDYDVSQALKEAADELRDLKKVLSHTREIICEGATEGFNPMKGDWAERLFLNNANISRVLD